MRLLALSDSLRANISEMPCAASNIAYHYILNKNFKISGMYFPEADRRRVKSEYIDIGTYADVDHAVREPVRIINEVFGLKTLWSCEGHEQDWADNDGILGYVRDDKGEIIGRAFQESYIAFSPMYVQDVDKFIFYLRSLGFEEGSNLRHLCSGKYFSVFANFNSGHLEADVKYAEEGDLATIFLRVGSHNVNMSRAPAIDINGESFKNLSDSVSGFRSLKQADWDIIRDTGWELWLNILAGYLV
jgi:hypothetical protein